jgi:hypothetical protein
MVESIPMRGLRKAAKLLGGEPQVRAFLGVPAGDLYRWMRGQAPVPAPVVIRVIELLANHEATRDPGP